jgi:hypothetical protein
MKRRNFLASLLGVAAALPAAKTAAAVPRRILIQESPLAGFPYHEGETLWPSLRAGDALALVRETNNLHDPRAVRVDWQGHTLGYIPRVENTAIAQMLDRGERLTARIVRLYVAPDPWKQVTLAVEWAG